MEGREVGEHGPAGCRRDLLLLLVLLVAAGSVRAWLMTHTEVAARDSIGYIRYSWQLKNRPWDEVARTSEAHPGYPLVILAVSEALRPFSGASECVLMQFSAQLANSLAGTLLVIPMFLLGRELFGRTVGFGAALLFQVFPASGRILSDGLSEGVFLLCAATALWAAGRALRRRSPFDFGLTGLFGSLAYLTRPEGALIVAATGMVLLGAQFVSVWRQSWPRWLACGAALGLTAACVASPFVLTTQRLTTKPTAHILLEDATFSSDGEPEAQAPSPPALLASTFAVWWEHREGSTMGRARWALVALLVELMKGNYYVAWLAGLVGLWGFRDRLRHHAGTWVLLLIGLTLTLVLWRMAVVVGYLSNRHTLLILLCDIYWVAAGLLVAGRGLAWLADRLGRVCVRPIVVGSGLLGLLVLAALPKTLEPLHANRSGFRDVGLWLAQHAAPTDSVIDPYYWSHYYSGRVFTEGVPLQTPPGHQPMRYVVLERAGLEHVRLTLLPEAERLKDQGQLVYHWQGRRARRSAEVYVYAVPP